ncbi:hypothetical protein [Flavobacterium sp. 3HN19-14]|uniref:hypothetical protein n=1 Tax=Flavobacterium sp. 3HN19-14 TaxID=3448133 RepID=UPI003EE0E836
MKKITLKLMAVAIVAIAVFWACKSREEAEIASYLPQDVLPSCTLTNAEFDAWFADGKATENGFVAAANSLTFPLTKNCDFYQWSEQMFLWITSPAGKKFGDGRFVMESPSFYTVSPEDSLGKRTFIRHEKGKLLSAFPGVEKSFGVDSEQGQATGDALMSKDGAIVYYISMVNDVYAQWLTAVKNNQMSG